MITLDGIVWLEVADMERAGVKLGTLLAARKRGSMGYEFCKHPQDKRRLLVRYDTLKSSVKAVVDAVLGSEKDPDVAVVRDRMGASGQGALNSLRHHRLADGGSLPEQHVQKMAQACALLHLLTDTKALRAQGWNAERIHNAVVAIIKADELPLPTAYTKLCAKVRDYKAEGYSCVISKRWCNTNARKINAQQAAWLESYYALPIKPDAEQTTVAYNAHAKEHGWPLLTPSGVYQHLHQPEVKQRWWLGRHGEDSWRRKYSHKLKLEAASHRDALWCSDGTKCNYFYRTDNGMAAKVQMYLVMDTHSEAILGWTLGPSENFNMQFNAIKMALKAAGHKPAQLLYDNQGGHKRAEAQDFFARAFGVHFPSKPYESSAKPIESVIGRLQKQVMKLRWFFTGANIQAKREDSKANMEFVMARVDELPTLERLPEYVMQDVEKWNSAPHPHSGVARMEMYRTSVNPQPVPLTVEDAASLFWVQSSKQATYYGNGMVLPIGAHGEKVHLEVYADGVVDSAFLRKWTNARFVYRYDAEDRTAVRLYEVDTNGDLRYVATATTKQTVARALVDARPGDRTIINESLRLRAEQVERIRRELKEASMMSGIDADTLVMMGHHADKDLANMADNLVRTTVRDNYSNNGGEDILDRI